ncbi:MAG: hypothetical protein C0417_05985 [Chlorobiaceae bacterium]|nr:hypothetical protein [Chlorobiaceae bacterium]
MHKTYRIFYIVFFISALIIAGCTRKPSINLASYQKEITDWQIKRTEGLQKENGWLTLCGLFWLNEGENKFGTDSSNTIIFPTDRSPAYAGSIFLEEGQLRFKCAKGVSIICNDSAESEMKIRSDESGKATPTIMKLGSLNFHIIKRGDRLGVRVKDNDNPARINFKGLNYFPIELKWRVESKFEPYNPPKIIPIVNVLNQVNNDTCPGAIVFKIDGKEYRLDALREGKEFFIIFHDETAGKETYGMGRYLYAQLPDSANIVVIDFNKAYNPPCAFTEFATCPLPPKQNYLPIRIEAGEKNYASTVHH